mmetsp:Transcript_6052/g.10057  ORF Transcript_6052/g.10057 Transcript_6052/m.10057 type:complete len:325 (-) Transcript_6052:753-1727(-)
MTMQSSDGCSVAPTSRPRYQLLRSMKETLKGKLYLARQVFADGREELVVIKISNLESDIKTLEDPMMEASILKHLQRARDCPGKQHVCRIMDAFKTEVIVDKNSKKKCKQLWTVLELIKGSDVFDHVKKYGCGGELARALFRQIVTGVRFLHKCGVAHMDISLENIMVTRRPGDDATLVVKLIDFGMAVDVNTTDLGGVRGKPLYVAPEVLHAYTNNLHKLVDGEKNLELDARAADVYSLGVILFILATGGTPPYESVDEEDRAFVYLWTRGKDGIKDLLEMWEKSMSEDALDLVSNMLCPVNRRWTLADIANHRYVSRNNDKP